MYGRQWEHYGIARVNKALAVIGANGLALGHSLIGPLIARNFRDNFVNISFVLCSFYGKDSVSRHRQLPITVSVRVRKQKPDGL